MKRDVMLEVKNVSKQFEGHSVLNEVAFSCKEGCITGIIGKNGSGKTVLLKCIADFLKIDEGVILINGKQNNDYIKEDHKLGCIIESPSFIEKYSGLKNLTLLYGVLNKVDKSYLKSVMQEVGLDPELKKAVKTYSIGMKQRLAIAQAIMEQQEFLLLDEPMSGLDSEGILLIRNLLLKLKGEGKTIVMTTHDKEDLEILCDTVYEMKDGKIFGK